MFLSLPSWLTYAVLMVWNGSKKKASMKFMMLSVHMDTLCHFSQFSRIFFVKIQWGIEKYEMVLKSASISRIIEYILTFSLR